MPENGKPHAEFGPLVVMLGAVLLQVLAAVVMKSMADARATLSQLLWVMCFGLVAVLNVARIVVWGFAHRRYPLSTTFPMSSLFYPIMLGVAASYGDPINSVHVAGALLIACGVAWLTVRAPRAAQ